MSRGQPGPQTHEEVLRCYGDPVDTDCPRCSGDVFDLSGERQCTHGHTQPTPEVKL